MADEGQVENPGGATAGTIRRVPGNLLGFLTSRIAEYVDRTEGITAEIHEYPGQPAKLVLYGATDLFEPSQETADIAKTEVLSTNKILVRNFTSVVDEDILEIFFESRKKSGGGPVRNVQLNREKKWALIEFCEAEAVEGVMSRVPITMMSQELDVRPFTPLIQGEGQLENLEVRNLPKELTDDLLAMHIEDFEENEVSSAEYKSDGGEGEGIEDETRSLEQLGNTDRWKKTKGYVKYTITCLHPVQLKMLVKLNYPETVLEQLPTVKVEIDLQKNEISFEEDVKTVHSASLNLLETLSQFGLNRIDDKPEEHVELYKREKVMKYINNKLEARNMTCAWEVKEDTIVICSLEENISTCTKVINECVKEIKFPVSRESVPILFSREWEKEVEQIKAKHVVVFKAVSDKTSTKVTVVALDNEISGVASRVKAFLESQLDINSETVRYDRFSENFSKLYSLNSTLANNIVDHVAEGLLKSYHVTILLDKVPAYYDKYIITGTKVGRQNAKRRIAELDISFE